MDFTYAPSQQLWVDRITAFMEEHVYPAVPVYEAEMNVLGADRWKVIQVVEALKAKARAAGLWNMFMPPHSGHPNLEDSFQLSCYPFLVRPELESSGVMAQAGGGAGEPITSDIGGLLPIALCGLTSL